MKGRVAALVGPEEVAPYTAAIGRAAGARVVAIEGIPERIELARRFGAEEIADTRERATPEERVRALTGGYGAEVVLEATGVPAAFVEAPRPGGPVAEEHEVSLTPGIATGKTRASGLRALPPLVPTPGLALFGEEASGPPFDEPTDGEYASEEVGDAIERGEAGRLTRPAVVPVSAWVTREEEQRYEHDGRRELPGHHRRGAGQR